MAGEVVGVAGDVVGVAGDVVGDIAGSVVVDGVEPEGRVLVVVEPSQRAVQTAAARRIRSAMRRVPSVIVCCRPLKPAGGGKDT